MPILSGKGIRNDIKIAAPPTAQILLYNDRVCELMSIVGRTEVAGGAGLKLTFGYCIAGQSPASATSVTAVNGELVLSGAANTNVAAVLVAKPGLILPAGSWLVIKSVAGTAGSIAGLVLSVLRKRRQLIF